MTRVLHIVQSLQGGPATYLTELLQIQAERFGSAEVGLIAPKAHLAENLNWPPIKIFTFPSHARNIKDLLKFCFAVRIHIKTFQPTVIHLHSTFAGVVGRLALWGHRRRPAIVYCAHGWAFLRKESATKLRLYSSVERVLSIGTDKIVNISNHEHQAARAIGIAEQKLSTIHNGISALVSDDSWSLIQANEHQRNYVFVGRFDQQKGLDFLLEAFSAIKSANIILHIVGAPVLSTFRPVASGTNVKFYDWLPRARIAGMLRTATALVVPSRWEGFGLVAIEAMSVGCPVIASRVGGLTEIVDHGRTGFLFESENAEELQHILTQTPMERWASMRQPSMNRFEQHFTLKKMEEALFTVYKQAERARSLTATLPDRPNSSQVAGI